MSLSLSNDEATIIIQFVYGLDTRGRESAWEVKDFSTIIHKISIAGICDFNFMEHLLKSIKGSYADVYKNIDFDNEDDIDTLTNAFTDYEKDWAESYCNYIYQADFQDYGGTLTSGYEINDKTLFYDVLDDGDILEVLIDWGHSEDACRYFTNIMDEVELACVANKAQPNCAINKAVDVAKAAATTADVYAQLATNEWSHAAMAYMPPLKVAKALPPTGAYVYDPLKEAQELKVRYDKALGL